ncbi:MAG: efflux transporter periplasmic adaptor subunit, partial [Cyclobacteriaceae bacterium]
DVIDYVILRIQNGDTAIIDVDYYSYIDKKFKGIVTQIANTANDKVSADAVTEFEVRIRILNSSYQDLVKNKGMKYPFRPGMTASVDIITEVKAAILSVPLAAVTTRKVGEKEGENSEEEEKTSLIDQELDEVVFVVEEGIAVKKIVKTGISDFERIEILSGVEENDKVISGPFLAVTKRLKDGDAVKEKEKEQEKKDD